MTNSRNVTRKGYFHIAVNGGEFLCAWTFVGRLNRYFLSVYKDGKHYMLDSIGCQYPEPKTWHGKSKKDGKIGSWGKRWARCLLLSSHLDS